MAGSRKGTDRKRRMREWVLTDLHKTLQEFSVRQKLPSFGPDLGAVNGCQAADTVVVHRYLNKFEVPVEGDSAARRDRSIREMLARDAIPFEVKHSDDQRMAAARLSFWFQGFRPSYGFAAPTGASAEPTGEIQDIVLKLTEDKNWEVSADLVTYASTIAYRNHALKRLVRSRFRERFPYLTMNDHFREKVGERNGFLIFREMFRTLVTLNAVSRVTTVPKDNEDDRVITCEPLWDMVCQLSFMRDIRAHMKRKLGYDLATRGDLHKTLLNSDEVVTIDLAKASDNLSWDWVRIHWPPHMVKWLGLLRPGYFHAVVGDMDIYHTPAMFAPMGTGITFDVMTFSLLALLRFDRSASVFGDDIIVKKESVARALKNLGDMGMIVNRKKSFVSGKFRESCGGMYHDDIGYIVSYDFRYPEKATDFVVIANKLHAIIQAGQISFELEGILLKAWNLLISTYPRVAFEGTRESAGIREDVLVGVKTYEPDPPFCMVGVPDNPVDILSAYWQRQVHVNMGFKVVNTEARCEPCQHVETAMALFRGPVKVYKTTKTRVVTMRIDSFTATPLTGVLLASVVPT